MGGWTTCSGTALLLPLDNIDTDQLIPARFMSVPRSDGYGDYLLHDLRRDPHGALLDDFPLNQHEDVRILVAGRNFGSGSSREAAVYTLVDAGIRAVIAPSFGDIFSSNSVNNGLLPARVASDDAESLFALLETDSCQISIDLNTRTLRLGDTELGFDLQDDWRTKLINGWDDIDLTLQHAEAIRAFSKARHSTAPWAWPATAN